MVRPLRDDDRVQLLLIASVLLAVVIVGVSVVLNTVVYTQNSAQAQGGAQLSNAASFEFQTKQATQKVVFQLNHLARRDELFKESSGAPPAKQLGSVGDSRSRDLHDQIYRNLSENYEQALTRTYVESGNGFVEVAYNPGASERGYRLIQRDNSTFESPEGADRKPNWWMLHPNTKRTLGWLTLNIDVETTSNKFGSGEDPFSMQIKHDSDRVIKFEIKPIEQDGERALKLTTTWKPVGGGGSVKSKETICTPENGRVLLDIRKGKSQSGGCSFIGLNEYQRPTPSENTYAIQIKNGDNIVGMFSLVTNDPPKYQHEGGGPYSYEGCWENVEAAANEACNTPAVWTANVHIEYQGSRTYYSNTFDVHIYPEATPS